MSDYSGGQLERRLADLGHGEHLCTIYNNRSEQMAVVVPFITSGLRAGDRCVYIADDRTVDDVTSALEEAGLDVASEQSRGALLLMTKKDAYLRTGQFEPQAMIRFLADAVEEACDAGFQGFRVTGEMTWALGSEQGCDRIIEYEALLNRFFPGSRAMAVCQYNRQRFAPSVIHDVLRTHPRAVLGDQVCANLYYEPPELILSGGHEEGRVDWMISQLQSREREIVSREEAEASLRQSEQRFAGFMKHLPGLAWLKDARGRYVYANDAAVAAFQVARADLYGKTDEQLFSPETAANFRENDSRALASGSGIQVVETLKHADGLIHHSLVTKFPVHAPDGQPPLIGGMAIDITEQKRAEKAVRNSERIYRAIGESIDYGIWICDPGGRNIYASEAFLKLVGKTQEECSSYGWADALHPDDADRTIGAWRQCVASMGDWDMEHRFRGVDGKYHPVLARGVPVKDEHGNVVCWAGINLDIQWLKDAESSLRDADRRKDEFLAMLAHELRNPLAPIRSGLDILSLGEVNSEVIELMRRQVEHLVRLVDDLLDVSRIMRGRVELRSEPVELAQVVARATETARPLIDAQHHQFTRSLPPVPVWLHADPIRLAQVISNLLHNAAKYTEPGGHIWLNGELEGRDVLIHVRDNGIGIESQLLPHVFDLFTQAQRSIDRSQGGLGIGLTVCKSLVEMHGGSVSASSAGLGQGSQFTIRLPIMERVDKPLIGHEHSSGERSRRILIVDDNRAAARMLALLLGRLGAHEIRIAHDGVAALEEVKSFEPDILLLDIGLPKMNGYEVARHLGDSRRANGMLLVALTGYGAEEDRRKSRLAGFDEHLVKPPSLEEIQQLFSHTKLKQA